MAPSACLLWMLFAIAPCSAPRPVAVSGSALLRRVRLPGLSRVPLHLAGQAHVEHVQLRASRAP